MNTNNLRIKSDYYSLTTIDNGYLGLKQLSSLERLLLLFININMFKVAVRVTVGKGAIYTLIAAGLEGIILIGIIHDIFHSFEMLDILGIIYIYAFSLLLSVSLNPAISSIMKDTLRRFLTCIEGYYLFSRIESVLSIKKLVPYCAILLIPYCYIVLTSSTIDHYDNSDYFAVSYGIILPICIILLYGYCSPIYLTITILGLVVILYAGARGAFVCVLGAVVLMISHKVLSIKGFYRILLLIIIGLSFVFIMNHIDQAVLSLYRLMPDSRTISRLVSGAGVYDSSRLQMYSQLQKAIVEDPLIYRGILSDRIVGASVWLLSDALSLSGTYAHNLFLEVLYAHGVLLGGMMIIFGICMLFRAYHISVNYENDDLVTLLIILVGCSLVQLLFSSSYLINYHFWCLVGYVVWLLKNAKREASYVY